MNAYHTLQGTITYPTLGKEKSSSRVLWEGDMLVPRRVFTKIARTVDG